MHTPWSPGPPAPSRHRGLPGRVPAPHSSSRRAPCPHAPGHAPRATKKKATHIQGSLGVRRRRDRGWVDCIVSSWIKLRDGLTYNELRHTLHPDALRPRTLPGTRQELQDKKQTQNGWIANRIKFGLRVSIWPEGNYSSKDSSSRRAPCPSAPEHGPAG